jgi:DNA repair exonuclease SbcCD nuclease subunit
VVFIAGNHDFASRKDWPLFRHKFSSAHLDDRSGKALPADRSKHAPILPSFFSRLCRMDRTASRIKSSFESLMI